MSGAAPSPVDDPARIGALLSGRLAPRARMNQALATYLAPLNRLDLADCLGASTRLRVLPSTVEEDHARIALLTDADERTVTVAVPDRAAARLGTRMLGGSADAVPEHATPIDWHLMDLVLDRIADALPGSLRHRGWSDGTSVADGASTAVRIGAEEDGIMLRIDVPAALLPLAAQPAATAPRPTPRPRTAASPDARLEARASIDIAPRPLAEVMALAAGDVLPLTGGLDAVDVRVGERSLLTGALGHAGGRLCLRIGTRAPEQSFTALRPPAMGTSESPGQDRAATA